MRFGVNEGLSTSSVYDIFQDKKGFLWIATSDGLNRFDGYEFKEYRVKNSLNDIHFCWKNIRQDENGNLWVSGRHEIYFFDYTNEELIRYTLPDSCIKKFDYVLLLGFDKNKNPIMITEDLKIFVFDKKQKTFREVYTKSSISIKGILCLGSAINEDGNFLLGTNKGLLNYEADKNFIDTINNYSSYKIPISQISLAVGHIQLIASNGCYFYDNITNSIGCFHNGLAKFKSKLYSAIQFQNKIFLATVSEGLYVYEINSDKIESHFLHTTENKSISFDVVTTFLIDRTQQLWIGTDGGGLNKLDLNAPKFKLYQTSIENNIHFSSNFTKCFYKDSKSRIWFGTHQKGLNIYDPSTNLTRILTTENNSIPGNIVTAIMCDSKKRIWITTDKGVTITDESVSYLLQIGGAYCYGITECMNNEILFATGNGVYYYDEYKKKMFPAGDLGAQTYCVFQTSDGKIWTGNQNNSLKHYDFITTEDSTYLVFKTEVKQATSIRCILQDKINHHLWLASESGLMDYDLTSKELKLFNENNGLANHYVYGILPDKENNLWLSTNKGISFFNPKTKIFSNFTTADGLQSLEFNTGAFYKSNDGEMFFGGINGFNSFYPENIKFNNFESQIQLCSFSIFGKEYAIDSLLNNSSIVDFSYNKNSFGINFSLLDFTNSTKNTYFYSIDNNLKSWISLGKDHHIHLSELSPGHYDLSVKAVNNDGIALPTKHLIAFNILNPFYKTSWFISISLISIITFFSTIIWFITSQKLKVKLEQSKREQEILKVRENISSDMHDEIGSGLSRISVLTQLAYSNPDGIKLENHLGKIKIISQQLNNQLSEMIWSVNPAYDTLESMFGYIRQYVSELCEENNLKYEINFPENISDLIIKPDFRRNIFSILKEVLNNSIRYANATEIKLMFEIRDETDFSFSISDNGCGFNMNEIRAFGNGLKNMKRRAEDCAIKFKIKSEEGKGTQILLSGLIENTT